MIKNTAEMIATMQAFQDGKEIEVACKPHCVNPLTLHYVSDASPTWNWTKFDYRVKTVQPRRVWMNEYAAGLVGAYSELESARRYADKGGTTASPFLRIIEFIELTPEVRVKLNL